jgi:alkanesulfonate monooxygenase SsuD/methylene tetrahydromethanopterin reductase-like flavin-dependent oxidoreductase (luciferase family)
MAEYLRVNIGMQKAHSAGTKDDQGALRKTSWVQPELSRFSDEETEIMVEFQVRNNLRSPLSFIGTPDQCARQAERLSENGVDEIACLIDFGIGFNDVMASLRRLSTLLS